MFRFRPALWSARGLGRFGTGVAFAAVLVSAATAQEVRWAPQQDAAASLPKSPADPTEAKVFAVFDRLCAGCHQSGKPGSTTPGGGLGHILDIGRMAVDPTLVRPGLPDASRLYTLMQIRAAPHDADAAEKDLEITAADLEAVRDWISGVKPRPATCADRTPLTRADHERALDANPPANPLTTRHLSLRAPYNDCASPADLKAYRHAVTVAVNSLSWSQKPLVLTTVDPQETLIRLDLTEMGWDSARWQKLVDAYPYAPAESLSSPAESPATLRAEWFTAHALKAPLYYELLGLPDRLHTLQSSLKVDATMDVAQNRARRIGVKTSTVARGSRLLQRHGFANGAFWLTHEYAPTSGRADLFDAPGGPGTRGAPKPDGSLAMFSLPSGYNAFYMANGDGLRVNDLPGSVLRNDAHPNRRITTGADCLACHNRGVVAATDELRARVQGDTSIPRDIRDKVLALHTGADEMRRLIDDDSTRFGGALTQSGLVPGATLGGVDPLLALNRWYERDVTLEQVASETDVSVERLTQLAARTGMGIAGDVVQRLLHGSVGRRQLERTFGSIVSAADGRATADGNAVAAFETDRAGPQLAMRTGPAQFKAGDALSIRVRTSESCHLTLINVDRTGRGTVVFPNDFEQNNFLEAGKELRVPADGAPYVFRLRDPGRETVIGHCMGVSKMPPGIRHDFERQRFTELGDYRAFLNRTAANEPDAKSAPKAAEASKGGRRRGGRAAGPAPMQAAPQKGEAQVRAAVVIEVVP